MEKQLFKAFKEYLLYFGLILQKKSVDLWHKKIGEKSKLTHNSIYIRIGKFEVGLVRQYRKDELREEDKYRDRNAVVGAVISFFVELILAKGWRMKIDNLFYMYYRFDVWKWVLIVYILFYETYFVDFHFYYY